MALSPQKLQYVKWMQETSHNLLNSILPALPQKLMSLQQRIIYYNKKLTGKIFTVAVLMAISLRNDLRERNHQNEDLKNKELYVVTTMLSSDAFTFTTDKSSRDNLKTIEALNRTNIKISAEFKAIQNDLYIAEDTNKKLQEELQANANNIQHMQVANSELEELLWNYLVLSLKLSSQNEDRKWGTLGKLRERVQAEKIPYSKWGEYILEALGENTSRANSNRNTTTTTTKTSRRTSKKK